MGIEFCRECGKNDRSNKQGSGSRLDQNYQERVDCDMAVHIGRNCRVNLPHSKHYQGCPKKSISRVNYSMDYEPTQADSFRGQCECIA